jgi:hypothetical protein
MSISQNFPSTRPSLNLNFARSQKLDPRITFTRSSSATYTGGDGLIKSAETDTPRFDFNATTGDCLGLLIEESRTNLLLRSQEFETSWGSAAATIGVNSTTSPDGTVTADKLQEDNTNNQHYVVQSIGTPSIGAIYTFSCWAKSAERTQMSLTAHGEGYSAFDLSSGTIIQTGGNSNVTITPYPNGWYRCSTTITKTNTNGNFYILNWNNTNSYTGTTGYGVYIWGAQVELASFPTSYIPTVASTVTRSADRASITGANFSSWYNQTEGTMFVDINSAPIATAIQVAYDINNGTTSERIFTRRLAAGTISTAITDNNTLQATIGGFAIAASARYRSSLAYKLNDFSGSVNGATNDTASSGTLPTVTVMNIGAIQAGTNQTNGTIAQLSYYPVRLSNSQLQTLTK